jgi:hypothetical protein
MCRMIRIHTRQRRFDHSNTRVTSVDIWFVKQWMWSLWHSVMHWLDLFVLRVVSLIVSVHCVCWQDKSICIYALYVYVLIHYFKLWHMYAPQRLCNHTHILLRCLYSIHTDICMPWTMLYAKSQAIKVADRTNRCVYIHYNCKSLKCITCFSRIFQTVSSSWGRSLILLIHDTKSTTAMQ